MWFPFDDPFLAKSVIEMIGRDNCGNGAVGSEADATEKESRNLVSFSFNEIADQACNDGKPLKAD
ncbi:hypothetical protein AGMMS50229_17160 [Campylobacterota bacterium]|nr:hypothetical protein AGMMS50229_17160 [Campylobacterota bacterium]